MSELNKNQVQGKTAIIIGWTGSKSIKVLQKAIINVLSDEDCEKNLYLITNEYYSIDLKLLCTAVEPYVLLECVRNFFGI